MHHFHFGAWEGTIVSSESLVEICLHGRGGQGAVTAANLLVAAALKDGNKGVQAFPFFGAERKKPDDFDFSKKFNVATVDATGIAIKHGILVGGMPVVNTPILGSVPRVLDKVTLQSIQGAIKNKWAGRLAEINVKATKDAYDSTEVNF